MIKFELLYLRHSQSIRSRNSKLLLLSHPVSVDLIDIFERLIVRQPRHIETLHVLAARASFWKLIFRLVQVTIPTLILPVELLCAYHAAAGALGAHIELQVELSAAFLALTHGKAR